jgi:hypothetical protein
MYHSCSILQALYSAHMFPTFLKQTITSTHTINQLVFVYWKSNELCEVWTGFLNIVCTNSRLQWVRTTALQHGVTQSYLNQTHTYRLSRSVLPIQYITTYTHKHTHTHTHKHTHTHPVHFKVPVTHFSYIRSNVWGFEDFHPDGIMSSVTNGFNFF